MAFDNTKDADGNTAATKVANHSIDSLDRVYREREAARLGAIAGCCGNTPSDPRRATTADQPVNARVADGAPVDKNIVAGLQIMAADARNAAERGRKAERALVLFGRYPGLSELLTLLDDLGIGL